MRRYRIIKCTPDSLVDMCKKNNNWMKDVSVVENALPNDAKCVRVIGQTGSKSNIEISIVIESTEFEELPEGAEIPDHPEVVFRRDTDGKLSTDAETS